MQEHSVTHTVANSYPEIANLYARYAAAINESNSEAFADCFTEQAVFQPNTGPFQENRGDFVGRQAIADFISDTASGRPPHVIFNVTISVEGDRADCSAMFALFDLENGEIGALGKYTDVAVHENGSWLFSLKSIFFLWQSEASAIRAGGSIPMADG